MLNPSRAPRPAVAFPPRKPMAAVCRVSLFEREIRVRLSSPAVEILFELAAVMSEGEVVGDAYSGSTMITMDLARAAVAVTEACDAAVARRIGELVAGDERVAARARRIALGEAEQRAQGRLRVPQIDLRVRAAGSFLHLDLDVEGTVGEVAA
jgi:hypothetical protein